MITSGSYKAALASASELEAVNIHLKARSGTVLNDLVELSSSYSTVPEARTDLPSVVLRPGSNRSMEAQSVDDRAWFVEMVSKSSSDGSSLHSLKIEALADDIAPYVTAHLAHARNVVAPMVSELAEKLHKFRDTAKAIDPVTQFEIVSCKVPEFLLDETFISDGLENYASMNPKYPYDTRLIDMNTGMALGISFEDPVKTAEFMSVGNERLNKMIFDWVGTLEADYLDKVYHAVFANYTDNNLPFDYKFMLPGAPGSVVNIYQGLNIATASYLVASSILRVTRGLRTREMDGIREKAREVLDYAGATINRFLRTIARQVSTNILVNEIDTADRKAYVHEPVYEAWLAKGGRPETILGMIVSGQVVHDLEAVYDARDRLDRAWSSYVVMSQDDIRKDLTNRLADYIKSEVLHGLNDLTEQEKEYSANDTNYRLKVAARIEKEIMHLGHRLTEDLDHTALHLIAKARFFYTSAYQILMQMVEVSKHNPDIDPREAALLSTISYLGDYFENQLVIER